MPSLGADMESGTIVEWRVKPGDAVHRGDVIAVIDTDKSTIDAEVFVDGVVEQLLVEPGVEVPVGTVLALLGSESEAPAPAALERGAFVRASPRARSEAGRRGLDLTTVAGTGPGGATTFADLERTARPVPRARVEPVQTAEPVEPADRQARMRHAIGSLMARSKGEIPHYYLATTIDMTASMQWLEETNEARAVATRMLPAALLLKATAIAAGRIPRMNGFWQDDAFIDAASVDLGVAVSLRGGGLITPAIRGADALDVDELMRHLRDLVQRARGGALRSSDVADPTITVTNLGDQGVEEVFGIIYPPQVAIVGFGRIVDRPWARSSTLEIAPVVRATLSADHRASDGHDGARFLAEIERLLQTPEDL